LNDRARKIRKKDGRTNFIEDDTKKRTYRKTRDTKIQKTPRSKSVVLASRLPRMIRGLREDEKQLRQIPKIADPRTSDEIGID